MLRFALPQLLSLQRCVHKHAVTAGLRLVERWRMALVRILRCFGRVAVKCSALRHYIVRLYIKCPGQSVYKHVRPKGASLAVTLLLMIPTILLADKPICVGLDADLSGSAALGGQAIERGARIAISHINATGGVLGRPLALKTMDHRGNPVRGVDNITALAKDPNCVAVLSGVHTPVVLQELPLLHDLQMPMLVPWAAGTPIIDNGFSPNYVFRLSVRDELAGQFFTKKLKAEGYQRIGLLLERTGWGRSNERSFGEASKAQERPQEKTNQIVNPHAFVQEQEQDCQAYSPHEPPLG